MQPHILYTWMDLSCQISHRVPSAGLLHFCTASNQSPFRIAYVWLIEMGRLKTILNLPWLSAPARDHTLTQQTQKHFLPSHTCPFPQVANEREGRSHPFTLFSTIFCCFGSFHTGPRWSKEVVPRAVRRVRGGRFLKRGTAAATWILFPVIQSKWDVYQSPDWSISVSSEPEGQEGMQGILLLPDLNLPFDLWLSFFSLHHQWTSIVFSFSHVSWKSMLKMKNTWQL